MNPFVFAAVACLALFWLKKLKRSSAKRRNLPPGPPGKPIIGNLLDLPKEDLYIQATKWGEEYGDVIHLNVLGSHMVILNTDEAAVDLLEKRSAIYSDRLTTTMLHGLLGAEWFFAFAPYGELWRTARRMFQQMFTARAVLGYRGIITKYTHNFLRQLALSPNDFYDHIPHFSSGIILDSVYGIDILPGDPILEIGKQAVEAVVQAATPGSFLVDIIPWLKYWPSWVWGGGFKRKAMVWRKTLNDFIQLPYEEALKSMGESGRHSFISYWTAKLSDTTKDNDREFALKVLPGSAGTAFVGGYETTSSTLETFFLAMLLHPMVQAKAHEELDRVIGRNRLPDFPDEGQLPYIRAICMELLRWRPVACIGIPHRSIADDEYKGMFIPKGSIVIANAWAMLQNRNDYGANVENFVPERFQGEAVKRPEPAFGFGRRMCPGRHLAHHSLFLSVSSILHLYRIERKAGFEGEIKPEQFRWSSGASLHPEPFECSITPRFEGAIELITKDN